jgi:peptide/nickel transport system ATP-binding protein
LRIQKEIHVSYLFIKHDLATVKAIAHAIVVMYHGRVVEQGAKENILRPSHDPYTELLGAGDGHELAQSHAGRARGTQG